jgi:hypothetical protein
LKDATADLRRLRRPPLISRSLYLLSDAYVQVNSGLPGMGFGIYHSGIEVYGREISFGYSDDGCTGVFEVCVRVCVCACVRVCVCACVCVCVLGS